MQIGLNLSLTSAELQSKDCPLQGPHAGQKWLSLYTTLLLSHWLGTARARCNSAQKAEADPEGTNSWRWSDNHIPWSRVNKSFLGAGAECHHTASARNISENSKPRLASPWSGILSRRFQHQVEFGIRWSPFSSWALWLSFSLVWSRQPGILLLAFVPPCSSPYFPFCPDHLMPCSILGVGSELLLFSREVPGSQKMVAPMLPLPRPTPEAQENGYSIHSTVNHRFE